MWRGHLQHPAAACAAPWGAHAHSCLQAGVQPPPYPIQLWNRYCHIMLTPPGLCSALPAAGRTPCPKPTLGCKWVQCLPCHSSAVPKCGSSSNPPCSLWHAAGMESYHQRTLTHPPLHHDPPGRTWSSSSAWLTARSTVPSTAGS